MNISKYIGELLYKHECVVIPGLGGFITNYEPAKINPIQNSFTPPSKNVVFNVYLKMNDGLLINHIAFSENITYIESKKRVNNFVKKCLSELNNGKHIRFHDIGVLYNNDEGNIQFEPDKSINYLEDSFGLTHFISPTIKRQTMQQKIEEKIMEHKVVKSKRKIPGFFKWAAIISIPIIALIVWGIMNGKSLTDLYTNYSSFTPSSNFSTNNASPQKNISNNLSDKQILSEIQKIKATASTLKNDSLNKSIDFTSKNIDNLLNKDKDKTDENTTDGSSNGMNNNVITNSENNRTDNNNSGNINSLTKKYFIIGGSFENINNANRYVKNLKEKGYNSKIIGQNKYGYYRVSFNEFVNKNKALSQLKAIRFKDNKSAWLLIK